MKTIKEGGVAVALAKMAFGNGLGAEVSVDEKSLLTKNIGSLIIEVNGEISHDLLTKIGKVSANEELIINNEKFAINDLRNAYTSTFENLFPTMEKEKIVINIDEKLNNIEPRNIIIKKHNIAKPRVFSPIFSGTNCEYETLNAFAKEGAEVAMRPLINLDNQRLQESIETWAKEIDNSQILAFSGGFSAGDEPDGSAKFIVNVLKNDTMRNAVHRLLERDGLIIGICNGFQGLVKSGLLPFGEIKDLDENAPTLAHNAIGRHISQTVNVKVVNDDSVWLKGTKGQIFTIPISHGEGRFMASEEVLTDLYKKGQIATQYVDLEGNIAHGMPFNPNNSLFGIEGITSPCGKIFGRMGHGERFATGLLKNIPTANYHNVFKNGVEYFK